jgi:hypothetical protein
MSVPRPYLPIVAVMVLAAAGCGSSAVTTQPTATASSHPASSPPAAVGATSGCAQAAAVFSQVGSALAELHSAPSMAAAAAAINSSVTQLNGLETRLQGSDPRLATQVAAFAASMHTMGTDLQQGTSGQTRAAGPDTIKLNSAGDALVASCPGLHNAIFGS